MAYGDSYDRTKPHCIECGKDYSDLNDSLGSFTLGNDVLPRSVKTVCAWAKGITGCPDIEIRIEFDK